LSNTSAEFTSKRLELLIAVVPGLSRIAILWNTGRLGHAMQINEIHAVAARLGIHLEILGVRGPQECERAFSTMSDKGVGAVNVLDDAMFFNERTRLAALAAKSQVPAMYGHGGYVEAGGLLSYGPNLPALFRRAAT
jgi:putative ABC transport system substrate-binding protein